MGQRLLVYRGTLAVISGGRLRALEGSLIRRLALRLLWRVTQQ